MRNWRRESKSLFGLKLIGFLLSFILWWFLKEFVGVSDRVLPSIGDVFGAIDDFEPNILVHISSTVIRLLIGFILGIISGILIGISIFKFERVGQLLLPTIQSFRSIPPIATVPFFILWFGFSEIGKYVMVLTGIAFNIAVASFQILSFMQEKYQVMFNSFQQKPKNLTTAYIIPRILEELLPTIRFSLSTALGLVIVSELLGAQIGLGYLIQTSRSTYSMHVIFLAMLILGLISSTFDKLIVSLWTKITYWKK